MDIHENARTTPHSRALMVRRVLEDTGEDAGTTAPEDVRP